MANPHLTHSLIPSHVEPFKSGLACSNESAFALREKLRDEYASGLDRVGPQWEYLEEEENCDE